MAKKGKPARRVKTAAKTAKKPAKPVRKVKPVVLDEAAKAIEFYRKAFGAKERLRMPGPDGKIVHAEVTIGDSVFMLSDEMAPIPGLPGVYKSPKAAGFATHTEDLSPKEIENRQQEFFAKMTGQ
jgi:uncharacterized glyoxalase superfamily protein PhnB